MMSRGGRTGVSSRAQHHKVLLYFLHHVSRLWSVHARPGAGYADSGKHSGCSPDSAGGSGVVVGKGLWSHLRGYSYYNNKLQLLHSLTCGYFFIFFKLGRIHFLFLSPSSCVWITVDRAMFPEPRRGYLTVAVNRPPLAIDRHCQNCISAYGKIALVDRNFLAIDKHCEDLFTSYLSTTMLQAVDRAMFPEPRRGYLTVAVDRHPLAVNRHCQNFIFSARKIAPVDRNFLAVDRLCHDLVDKVEMKPKGVLCVERER
ncbi:hypothetical protein Taro_022267 [Colocasia esculenta]|uniref:Uncharacterized protein n=1 Tax=Colocasia esculenta TaxID=4460 RepID=A0A843V7F3_COLES|nr:hypothetical protein [Colocasia esculenta]